jgi:transposase InsO family protein
MDLWFRKIVGYHAGDTMEAEVSARALELALKELPARQAPARHSDCGSRYCSFRYVKAAGMR